MPTRHPRPCCAVAAPLDTRTPLLCSGCRFCRAQEQGAWARLSPWRSAPLSELAVAACTSRAPMSDGRRLTKAGRGRSGSAGRALPALCAARTQPSAAHEREIAHFDPYRACAAPPLAPLLLTPPPPPPPAPAACARPSPADSESLGARRASKVKYIYRLMRPGDVSESLENKTVRLLSSGPRKARSPPCCCRRRLHASRRPACGVLSACPPAHVMRQQQRRQQQHSAIRGAGSRAPGGRQGGRRHARMQLCSRSDDGQPWHATMQQAGWLACRAVDAELGAEPGAAAALGCGPTLPTCAGLRAVAR